MHEKVNGDFVWHKHEDTNDFFLVLGGHLTTTSPASSSTR